MITEKEVKSLGLQIPEVDGETCLLVENALDFIAENTEIKINRQDLSSVKANVRLFILKYIELMKLPYGITSESVSGLSQSFDSTDKYDLLLSLAKTILGDENVTVGKVRFVSASKHWKY